MKEIKLLAFDVETAPNLVYTWGLHNQFVAVNQIVAPSRVLCWAAKWLGTKTLITGSEWDDSPKDMMVRLRDLLDKADAVITYNGDRFDFPRIMGEFAIHGILPPAPVTSIDLYKTAKKLGLPSGKLEYVVSVLTGEHKMETGGFELWRGVLAEDGSAQRKMLKYNKQDVQILEKLYYELRPYMKAHPFLGSMKGEGCPACTATNVQKRGYRRTKAFLMERLQCQECGTWFTGARKKVV